MKVNMNKNVEYLTAQGECSSVKLECENIVKICNHYDKLQHIYFFEDDFDVANVPWLYYAKYKENIIGFVSVYAYDQSSAEICCFVLPEYRKCNICTKLFKKFYQNYKQHYLYLPVRYENVLGINILSHFGFQYSTTEYEMQLLKSDFVMKNKSKDNLLLNTNILFNDISQTAMNNVFSFQGEYKNRNNQSVTFRFFYQDTHIGCCHAFLLENVACIHDLEIYEQFQRKGFGYNCLLILFRELFNHFEQLKLHVTKENTAACRLYQKLGFQIIDAIIYYCKKSRDALP